jgi:hypothetical protein
MVAAIGAAWAVPAAGALGAAAEPIRISTSSYVVREATRSEGGRGARSGQDPRPLVDELASMNDLDPGMLVPGQTLLIPSGV